MIGPRREKPPPFVSRIELARELSISENSVEELVRQGILPIPTKQSSGRPRWSWRAVEIALAMFEPAPTARTMNR
jgi:hypothetical protein